MTIPIQNLYYLLSYAWDKLEEMETVDVSVEGVHSIVELLGRVLVSGCNQLLRRGIDRGYVPHEEVYGGVKGRISLAATIRGNHLAVGRTVCSFDEFTHDVVHNQILKATIRLLADVDAVPSSLRSDLLATYGRFEGVSSVKVSRSMFRSVQLHRNNRVYELLLSICQLVHDGLFLEQESGRIKFRDFAGDPQQMGALFERFVFNFLAREQKEYKVSKPQIEWLDLKTSKADRPFFPVMKSDVVLTSASRVLIIETKFYADAIILGRSQTYKVRSSHLYQLFTYLQNYPASHERPVPEGLLLYPRVEHSSSLEYTLGDHRLRVVALDLNKPWPEIHSALLAIAFA